MTTYHDTPRGGGLTCDVCGSKAFVANEGSHDRSVMQCTDCGAYISFTSAPGSEDPSKPAQFLHRLSAFRVSALNAKILPFQNLAAATIVPISRTFPRVGIADDNKGPAAVFRGVLGGVFLVAFMLILVWFSV